MNSDVNAATKPSGNDGMLAQLLQKDQLATTYYLNKGCQYALNPDPDAEWNRVQKHVYPVFCLIAATFNALKDALLYPIQGALRVCTVIISGKIEDMTQGVREMIVSTPQTLALSVYLLSLSIIGLFSHKPFFTDNEEFLKAQMFQFSPPELAKKRKVITNPSQLSLYECQCLKFDDWITFTDEALQEYINSNAAMVETAQAALETKKQIRDLVEKRSYKAPPVASPNTPEIHSSNDAGPSDIDSAHTFDQADTQFEQIQAYKKVFKEKKKRGQQFTTSSKEFQEAKQKFQERGMTDILGESETLEKYYDLVDASNKSQTDCPSEKNEVSGDEFDCATEGDPVDDDNGSAEKQSDSADEHKKVQFQEQQDVSSEQEDISSALEKGVKGRRKPINGYLTVKKPKEDQVKQTETKSKDKPLSRNQRKKINKKNRNKGRALPTPPAPPQPKGK